MEKFINSLKVIGETNPQIAEAIGQLDDDDKNILLAALVAKLMPPEETQQQEATPLSKKSFLKNMIEKIKLRIAKNKKENEEYRIAMSRRGYETRTIRKEIVFGRKMMVVSYTAEWDHYFNPPGAKLVRYTIRKEVRECEEFSGFVLLGTKKFGSKIGNKFYPTIVKAY
ncbi:hypothetical protein KKE34_05675, partial [Patescibacteria group bacterium]|nr:hypothetical protein [Patescibacteria group bacterium]